MWLKIQMSTMLLTIFVMNNVCTKSTLKKYVLSTCVSFFFAKYIFVNEDPRLMLHIQIRDELVKCRPPT